MQRHLLQFWLHHGFGDFIRNRKGDDTSSSLRKLLISFDPLAIATERINAIREGSNSIGIEAFSHLACGE